MSSIQPEHTSDDWIVGPAMQRKRVPQDSITGPIRAALDEAGFPRAEWDKEGNVIKDGYRLKMGVEISYIVNPHVREVREAKTNEILTLLKEHFQDKIVEVDGKRWKLNVQRVDEPDYGFSHVMVDMHCQGEM